MDYIKGTFFKRIYQNEDNDSIQYLTYAQKLTALYGLYHYYNDDVTKLSRMHNDANMISFSQRFMTLDDVLRRTILFLETKFEGGRHQTRVDLISDIEK